MERDCKLNIGVFLLIEPFASVEAQLEHAKKMGFTHADITDTNADAFLQKNHDRLLKAKHG
jgi:hypothetical protein